MSTSTQTLLEGSKPLGHGSHFFWVGFWCWKSENCRNLWHLNIDELARVAAGAFACGIVASQVDPMDLGNHFWLVVTGTWLWFSYILVIIPTEELIFFGVVEPPTRSSSLFSFPLRDTASICSIHTFNCDIFRAAQITTCADFVFQLLDFFSQAETWFLTKIWQADLFPATWFIWSFLLVLSSAAAAEKKYKTSHSYTAGPSSRTDFVEQVHLIGVIFLTDYANKTGLLVLCATFGSMSQIKKDRCVFQSRSSDLWKVLFFAMKGYQPVFQQAWIYQLNQAKSLLIHTCHRYW